MGARREPQAWQTDRGPALMDIIVALAYLLGMAVPILVVLFAFALLLAAAAG